MLLHFRPEREGRTRAASLDHLVGGDKKTLRDGQTQLLGDREFDFCRLPDWQIGWFRAAKDFLGCPLCAIRRHSFTASLNVVGPVSERDQPVPASALDDPGPISCRDREHLRRQRPHLLSIAPCNPDGQGRESGTFD